MYVLKHIVLLWWLIRQHLDNNYFKFLTVLLT